MPFMTTDVKRGTDFPSPCAGRESVTNHFFLGNRSFAEMEPFPERAGRLRLLIMNKLAKKAKFQFSGLTRL